jgi:hypothetical protein
MAGWEAATPIHYRYRHGLRTGKTLKRSFTPTTFPEPEKYSHGGCSNSFSNGTYIKINK